MTFADLPSHQTTQTRALAWDQTDVLALGIVLLGAILRFMQMDLIRYGYDHSYSTYQALGLLDAGIWPVIGQPSSVFLDNPALMPYLQAIPLLIVRSPLIVQAFILFFNTIAIWFVYRAGRDMLRARAGLIAAFLFAVNPWVITFSRTTWVQSLVPFFMAVGAWGLWPAFTNDDAPPWRFLAGALAIIAMTQTYVQAWGVLPGIVILLLINRRSIPRKAFMAATAVFVTATAIYAAGLLTDSTANLAKLQGFLGRGGELRLTSEGAEHALRLVNGLEFATTWAGGSASEPIWQAAGVAAVLGLGAALATGIVLAILAWSRGGRDRRVGTVLLIWFVFPILLTTLAGSQEVHPHYLLLTLPAGQLLAAWALSSLCTCRTYTVVIVGFLLLVGAGFTHDIVRANQVVANNPVWPDYDGWSLASAAALGDAITPRLDPPAAKEPARLAADGHSALLSGMTDRYVRAIDDDVVSWPDFVLLPATGNLTYVREGDIQVPDWLAPYFSDDLEVVDLSPTDQFTILTTAEGAAQQAADSLTNKVGWASEAGVSLDGYSLTGERYAGGTVDLTLVWRVDELAPDRGEWYISPNIHLVTNDGQIVANSGDHGLWAYDLVLGDVYIERLVIPIPDSADPGSYTISIGLFDPLRSVDYTMFDNGQPTPRLDIPVQIGSQ
ncbi:MAG: glycosyltransferase family 39 protein [Chloroflexota bacterium]